MAIQVQSGSAASITTVPTRKSKLTLPGRLPIRDIENRLASFEKSSSRPASAPTRGIATALQSVRMQGAHHSLSAHHRPAECSRPSGATQPKDDQWIAGRLIAKGGESEIRESSANPRQVLKIFNEVAASDEILSEVRALDQYYGSGFAQLSPDGRSILMRRLEGVPLHLLRGNEKPQDLPKRVLACVERIVEAGIFPSDLCEANFLYDPATGIVSPVDLKSADAGGAERAGWIAAFQGGMKNLMNVAGSGIAEQRKAVSFGGTTVVEFPSGPIESSARLGVQLKSLDRVRRRLDDGLHLNPDAVKKALVHCLAINSDYRVVSKESESLILRAFEEVSERSDHTYAIGSFSCNVIHAFATRFAEVRPSGLPA